MILAGTNILLRSIHLEHPHHILAESALTALRLRNEALCIAPQNLVEFWAVATRSRTDNGLDMTIARAADEVATLRRFFLLLPYTAEVPEAWQRIVLAQGISGKQTHDAHLAAIMQVNAVASILTFDSSHFERFPGIGVLNPAQH